MKHVLIVGGGFGGLMVARKLADAAEVQVTLVDRLNHHLFQPLLYQVATAGLSPANIAVPIRALLRHQANARVLLGEVESVDLKAKTARLMDGEVISFDVVVLAPGFRNNYYGHKEWKALTLGLKDLDDAIEIRRRVLLAFEAAERESDPDRQAGYLNFVVIGAGPTGVELAGALVELADRVLVKDFRNVDPRRSRVILLEGGDRVLPGFEPELSISAKRQLEDMGVDVRVNAMVDDIQPDHVRLRDGTSIETHVVLWAAGVGGRRLNRSLGVELDRIGRVKVEPDCSIPGFPDAFVIGDSAAFPTPDGKGLPAVAQVALQQGRHVAKIIKGAARKPFSYFDKGLMATIGRSRAVVQSGPFKFGGFFAWFVWLFIHLVYLIGHRNRIVVMMEWIWSYLTFGRGSRLITRSRPRTDELPMPAGTKSATAPDLPRLPPKPTAVPAAGAPAAKPTGTSA